eukprot:2020017-Amphidinium_carterae.1
MRASAESSKKYRILSNKSITVFGYSSVLKSSWNELILLILEEANPLISCIAALALEYYVSSSCSTLTASNRTSWQPVDDDDDDDDAVDDDDDDDDDAD